MKENRKYDVAVIGGGPAGMAAALAAEKEGAKVILIEREERLGGILKQCIHDGFGLIRFKKKMAGPEYAEAFIKEVKKSSIEVRVLTFVTKVFKSYDKIQLTVVSKEGIEIIQVRALVLSTGCRERTAKQIAIHGTRPGGVYTAGTAQYYTNILGQLPTKKCVILGSGDIGLIMARRLTLEGATVLGVYEAKSSPSGLRRNIAQCLKDFNIPLYTSHTVTRVFGQDRLQGVEISKVDENMIPIKGTEELVECDSLILSVGLIPENELAESLTIPLDERTKGPIADQNYMTLQEGVFTCGNAFHVNDLVDYVSESGEGAGKAAAFYARRQWEIETFEGEKENTEGITEDLKGKRENQGQEKGSQQQEIESQSYEIEKTKDKIKEQEAGEGSQGDSSKHHREIRRARISTSNNLLYAVPQVLDINSLKESIVIFFRCSRELGPSIFRITVDGKSIFERKYKALRPPEMERVQVDFSGLEINERSNIQLSLEEVKK